MEMVEAMARNFFGYGRWDAPYWFIGLEQGGSNNVKRAKAFNGLQSDGLCDCRDFHFEIGVLDWHGQNARIQRTWGRLMRLLASFHSTDAGELGLLNYQKNHWGSREGDTCVIELSGLSAAGLNVKMDRKKQYLAERTNTIRRKLKENTPQIVVMYGFTGEAHFQALAECDLVRGGLVERRNTLFIYVDHPTRQRLGNTDKAWNDLGREMRANAGNIVFDHLLVEGLERGFSGQSTTEAEFASSKQYLKRS
jgi:hypothetical protein